MAEPIKHQIIKQGEDPLFVLVPYNEYMDLIKDEDLSIPHEVVEKHIMEEKTMIKAWREYKGISQKVLAKKIGISQAALSQMETRGTERKSSVEKLAKALGIEPEQLSV